MMIFVRFVNIQILRQNVHFVLYVQFVFTSTRKLFDMCYFACKLRKNTTDLVVSYVIIELALA